MGPRGACTTGRPRRPRSRFARAGAWIRGVPPAAGAGVSRTAASPRRIAGGVSRPEGRAAAGDCSMVLLRCQKHKAPLHRSAADSGCKDLSVPEQEIRAAASISPEDSGEWAGGAFGGCRCPLRAPRWARPRGVRHSPNTIARPRALQGQEVARAARSLGRARTPSSRRRALLLTNPETIPAGDRRLASNIAREAPHLVRARRCRETMTRSCNRDFYGD
jgi:hypothetical protein